MLKMRFQINYKECKFNKTDLSIVFPNKFQINYKECKYKIPRIGADGRLRFRLTIRNVNHRSLQLRYSSLHCFRLTIRNVNYTKSFFTNSLKLSLINYKVVLCQYFGHKKSNFFMLHFQLIIHIVLVSCN